MDTFEESASRILEGMAEAGRRQQRPAQFVVGKVLEVSEKELRVSPAEGDTQRDMQQSRRERDHPCAGASAHPRKTCPGQGRSGRAAH